MTYPNPNTRSSLAFSVREASLFITFLIFLGEGIGDDLETISVLFLCLRGELRMANFSITSSKFSPSPFELILFASSPLDFRVELVLLSDCFCRGVNGSSFRKIPGGQFSSSAKYNQFQYCYKISLLRLN